MQTATETERKYDVPAGFALPPLAGAAGVTGFGEAATHELDATYFDTDDLRLARSKRTLRRRTGGDDAGWHLKTPGDGSSRTEHRVPLDGEGDDVPGELVAVVRTIVRTRALRPVARLRTHRVETPLRDAEGRTLALVAQDQVGAETDDGEQRWQEVEVELVDGGPEVLEAVEGLLRAAGATPASGPSKLARALGDRLAPPRRRKKKIDPVLGYAREQRAAIEEHDPGVRAGEVESVHKMRVATRRLRSTLKTFKDSFVPERADLLKGELKWLADVLGAVRDGQVQAGKLLPAVADFPEVVAGIRERLDADVARGHEELVAALDSDRYLALLDAIDTLVDEPEPEDAGALRRARKVLGKADRLLDQAVAGGVDVELHEARKAYKQARYAVEIFAPAAGKPGKRLVKALTELQEVLGAHQDSVVARELLREIARTAPDAFGYGVLYARQERVGEETHAQLPAVIESSRGAKLRSWLG